MTAVAAAAAAAAAAADNSSSICLAAGTLVRHAREGHRGVVHFCGPIPELAPEDVIWAGVEWLEHAAGKNDGALPKGGRRLFGPVKPNHGSFLRLGKLPELAECGGRGDPLAHVLLRQRSLAEVLAERYGGSLDDDVCVAALASGSPAPSSATAKRTSHDPFARDRDTGAWPNVVTVSVASNETMRVVATCDKRALSLFFPNLKTVSIGNCLLHDWRTVFEVANSLPLLATLDVSDNPLLVSSKTFPALDDHDDALGICSSTALTSLNVTNTMPPDAAFVGFLAAFPNLKELFYCHNDLDALPRFDTATHVGRRAAKTFASSLEHLVLAHNRIRSLASIIAAARDCGGAAALTTLNLSDNARLARIGATAAAASAPAEVVAAEGEQQAVPQPLFPRLSSLLIRNTGFETWNEFLSFFERGAFVADTLTEIACSGMALLHPERAAHTSARAAFDPVMLALYDEMGGAAFSDGERRRLCVAMLPDSVRKLNGTLVEKTTWFGEAKTAARPELAGARRWLALRLGAVPEDVRRRNRKAQRLYSEHEEEVRAAKAAATEHAGPKLLQTEFRIRVVPLFESVEGVFAKMDLHFADEIEKLREQHGGGGAFVAQPRHRPAAVSGSEGGSAVSAVAPGYVPKSQRDAAMSSMTLTVDARWTNAELEMAVAVLLGLCDGGVEIGPTVANVAAASATAPPPPASSASSSSRYVASRLSESADVWVGLDIALGRYARARREASEGEEANLPARRREALDLWSQVFPSGSLSLWLADMEMCDNVGAVQRGMHLRHLLRPAASLHSSRISDDCVLLVVVHQ